MLCRRWIKKSLQVLLFEMPKLLEFLNAVNIYNRALVITLVWFEAYARKEHSCSSSAGWPSCKTDLICNCEELHVFLGMESVHSSYSLTADGRVWEWCDVRQQVAKWCHTLASGRNSVMDNSQISWQSSLVVSQQCTHWGTPLDGQTYNFVVCGIWPWLMLQHCTA